MKNEICVSSKQELAGFAGAAVGGCCVPFQNVKGAFLDLKNKQNEDSSIGNEDSSIENDDFDRLLRGPAEGRLD